jgi:hypothetical protein
MLQLDLGCLALRLCLIYRLDESGRIDSSSDRRLEPAHSSFGIVETLLRGVPAAINALGSCQAGDCRVKVDFVEQLRQQLVERADKGGLGQVDVLGMVGQGRSARNDASRCRAIVSACLARGSFHTSQAEAASDPAAEEVGLLGRPGSTFQLLWARGATEATQQLNVDEVVHRHDGGMCRFS